MWTVYGSVCAYVSVCVSVHFVPWPFITFTQRIITANGKYQSMPLTYNNPLPLVCIYQWRNVFSELQTVVISLVINRSVTLAKHWPELNLQLSQLPPPQASTRYAISISNYAFVDSCLTSKGSEVNPFNASFIWVHFEFDTFRYFCCNFHASFI